MPCRGAHSARSRQLRGVTANAEPQTESRGLGRRFPGVALPAFAKPVKPKAGAGASPLGLPGAPRAAVTRHGRWSPCAPPAELLSLPLQPHSGPRASRPARRPRGGARAPRAVRGLAGHLLPRARGPAGAARACPAPPRLPARSVTRRLAPRPRGARLVSRHRRHSSRWCSTPSARRRSRRRRARREPSTRGFSAAAALRDSCSAARNQGAVQLLSSRCPPLKVCQISNWKFEAVTFSEERNFKG